MLNRFARMKIPSALVVFGAFLTKLYHVIDWRELLPRRLLIYILLISRLLSLQREYLYLCSQRKRLCRDKFHHMISELKYKEKL